MQNHKLVMREHLNHYGYLFGGNLLKWVDEHAWIGATMEFPGCSFVTIAMDNVEFRKSVGEGTILRFEVDRTKTGRTSVQYEVNVFRGEGGSAKADVVFSTHVTLVRVDEQGHKTPLPS
ncbi:MAG: acyl-CoA thioesterase [Lentisphaerae bacterium]|jgi:acyl-CoA hydrolase|nr:acyl-CoA thioesterase [Lentisphaerota bacterium]MBT4820863.1 acyl-CoA thioesterase [Lentisphaerota bacterium]MBT5607301.1 acyl-CoA thioesterase [Lentisphaerota bacterium]MBT7055381.1 acyl-CoA thioesterase [Lentisphaerota bacterium]MBT7840979.1 acyl-CoA thioesterase [Lentisphaerota bacterium]